MSNKKLIDKYERKLEQLKTMQSIIEKRTNGATNFRSDISLIEEFVQDLKGKNFNSPDLLKQALVSGQVCPKCKVEMEGATYKGCKMCHICREWQTLR